ncbi:hypothetical protein FACS189442_3160 [Spirochaetia bacterium]|nr:hypothetical protein FACS189442_3160 [Spirochaetia bacterium]
MKGTKGLFRLGAIALALSLMVLTGCPDPNGGGNNPSDPFAGTWEGAGTLSYFATSGAWKIIAADGSFKVHLTDGQAASNLEVAHGPYTYSGSTVILTITQTLQWSSVGNTITNSRWENSGAPITANIIDNTITTGGVTFTRTSTTGNVITAGSSSSAAEVKAALTAYLSSASGGGSAANPVVVKINVSNLSQLTEGDDGIGVLFTANTGDKYVSYDLSGSNLTTISGSSSRNFAYKLVAVLLPGTLTSIGGKAFARCSGLTSVTIGNGVTSIGRNAFRVCSNLSAIQVNAGNTAYSTIDGVLFNKSGTELVEYPNGKGSIYTIPNSVTSIGRNAFQACANLSRTSGVPILEGARKAPVTVLV